MTNGCCQSALNQNSVIVNVNDNKSKTPLNNNTVVLKLFNQLALPFRLFYVAFRRLLLSFSRLPPDLKTFPS